MRRTLLSTMSFLLSFCLFGTLAFAQSGKGSLSGRVADSVGAVLQGAQVELFPRAADVATNSQGEFKIANLNPGTYTVKISYIGFEPFTQEVTITAGKETQLKAVIKVQSNNDEVTVLSERQSAEAEAINRTKTAENILQVLPAEVIMSLPNANIADALGRMPSVTIERDEGEGKYVQIRGTEPRLTNIMVDGITIPSPETGVRQIKLDTIASDLVESVEINKTLQANIDADGIGGSVNLRTKTASEAPTVALYGVGGYTPIKNDGRGVMQSGGTLGKRFGDQKKLGVLIGGTYDYNGRGIDDIEPAPNTDSLVPHYGEMDIRDYVYDRTRWGATASVDYKLGEGSSIYMRGLFSTFRNWGHKWTWALNDGAAPGYSQDWRRPNMAIGNLVLGGKHVFSDSWLAWDASVGRSRSEGGSGSAKYTWTGDSGIGALCYNDQSLAKSVNRPGWSAGCFNGTGTDNVQDRNNYSLSSFTLPAFGQSAQLNLTGSVAFAKNYHAGSHFGTLEVGGKIRNAHKYDNSWESTWKTKKSAQFIPISAHPEWDSDYTDTGYYDKTYKIGSVTNFNAVRAWVLANQGAVPLSTKPLRADNSNAYDYVERVSAGYVMNTINVSSKLRLVTGLRFEQTHLNAIPADPTQVVKDDYLDVLPSASLRIALPKNSALRLVYGRGLARPDPQDIAQTSSLGDPGVSPYAVSIANPNLKAEYANNYDVLFEKYLKPGGLFQAGFFYKDINNPIVTGDHLVSSYTDSLGTHGVTKITQVQNVGSAHVMGLELSYQQRLSFLPGVLHGLGLSTNYSYTSSQAKGLLPLYRTDTPALQRQAPNTWNFSPTYDTKKFSMRLGMTYNDAMIYAYQFQNVTLDSNNKYVPVDPTTIPGGTKGPAGDNYLYSHYQIDVQGQYKVTRSLSVYAYGLNLNNEVFGFYNGGPQYVVQREYYKPTYAGGLRYNFARE